MSPRLRREPFAADHERARELSAQRVDSAIDPDDARWLNDHLSWCRPCRAVAAEYDEQRLALRALRFERPVPPRDLWARTAARIEAEPRRRRAAPGRHGAGFGASASLVGVLIVALVTATVVLDRVLPPLSDSTLKGEEPEATPIDLVAGEIQVLSHADDGSLEIQSKYLDQVCPVAASSCGIQNTLDVTKLGSLGTEGDLDAIVSPDRGQLVVVERGAQASTVYVVPLKRRAVSDPSPGVEAPTAVTATQATTTGPSDEPASTAPASDGPAETATTEPPDDPDATDEPSTDEPPSGDASASSSPESTEPPDDPDATDEPAETGDVQATPDATPKTTPDVARTTQPTEAPPSIAVTPRPDGAIEIASDVVIVGSAAGYSPDGTRFAFSARPADGSAGPDVYVWQVGGRRAKAVTTGHDAQLAGWLGDRLVISRVVDGKPVTVMLDLDDRAERVAGDGAMWLPTVGPEREHAAWWDGTVRLDDDGMTWVPDKGRLVLGAWPGGTGDTQVLADRPVTDWDVQWDETGTRLAVWVSRDGPDAPGLLSLYPIDPDTGRADLGTPTLEAAPAYAGFALQHGRLAWSAPASGGDTSVEVLAWDGDSVGKVSLPADTDSVIVR